MVNCSTRQKDETGPDPLTEWVDEDSLKSHLIRANPPKVLSVPEGATFLGISERNLRELIALRKIKSCRIGRRIVIRLQDIDAYLEGVVR